MTATNKSGRRALASLKLPHSVPALITYSQGIVNAMTGNPTFPVPSPTLAVIQAAIDDLQKAETAAQARTKGAVAARNSKRSALIGLLDQLRSYVQSVADGDIENGAAIVEKSTMMVRKVPVRPPRSFEVKLGTVSGTVKLSVPAAARRAAYDWESSTDGGKTWSPLPSTLQAKTTVTGLAVASTPQFRYRPVTKAGEGDWSQPISILVK
jgi:hypothetical protein